MKSGDKIPIVLEIVRPVEHGEKMRDTLGNDFELMNVRGDKFWAKPVGSTSGPLILVCSNLETEAGLLKRRAIVDLIECGVAG